MITITSRTRSGTLTLVAASTLTFALFGWLLAADVGNTNVRLAVIAGVIAQGELVLALLLLVTGAGPLLRSGAWLIPFAVLAAGSEMIVGWHAAGVFAAAGLTSVAAAVSADLCSDGRRRIGTCLLISASALLLSVGWLSWAGFVNVMAGG